MDEHFTFDSCLDADDLKIEIKKYRASVRKEWANGLTILKREKNG